MVMVESNSPAPEILRFSKLTDVDIGKRVVVERIRRFVYRLKIVSRVLASGGHFVDYEKLHLDIRKGHRAIGFVVLEASSEQIVQSRSAEFQILRVCGSGL
jgi:hypothetical protein